MENLVSLVGDSGQQPAADWPAAKGYSSPEVKVYGKAVDLTAAGTGPEGEAGIDPLCRVEARLSCRA
jgi:hypothetical protein